MQSVSDLIAWYPLFGVPAIMGWTAVWVSAGAKRVDLQFGDRALLVLPWLVLCLVSLLFPQDKSFANFAEIVLLAAAVPLGFIVRVTIGRVEQQASIAMRTAWAVSLFGAVVWLLVPDLGTPAA